MLSLLYFTIAACFGILSINASQRHRPLSFLVESIFVVLSYRQIPELGFPSYHGYFHLFLIIWHLHMSCTLFVERYASPSGLAPWDWRTGYKMLFNSRWVGTTRQAPGIARRKAPRFSFMRNRILSFLAISAIDQLKPYALTFVLGFEPFKYNDSVLLKRTLPRFVLQFLNTELDDPVFRIYLTVSTLWTSYGLFTRFHDLFAIVFVSMGLDQPEDWPALYGNITEAYTLGQFWGKFWHKLIYRSGISYASYVSIYILGLSRSSPLGGLFVKFFVFLLSGINHAIEKGTNSCAGAWWDDIWFYLLNFTAIMMEMGVQAIVKKIREKIGWAGIRSLDKLLGYFWVFGFLCWSMSKFHFRSVKLCGF